MSILTTIVDELPEHARKSARESICKDVVDLAVEQSPKYISIDADTTQDLARFYKTMIQYRIRHNLQKTLQMRKHRDSIHIWFTPEEHAA